tara:strand:+ start:3966 stop:4775 length:810 start_codon:yes stop_codon:yes gene_type:complete
MNIPTLIEKDIKSGKARYSTFQTGMGGQSVLTIPPNSYIIIYGYDYSPAGGGLQDVLVTGATKVKTPDSMSAFETQQISFYTGQAFHPFIHHIDTEVMSVVTTMQNNEIPTSNSALSFRNVYAINTTPINRSTYIISNRNVAITVGLIQRVELNQAAAIPVTADTPANLTYGGDIQTPNVESVFSSNLASPPSLVQPSLKNFLDYGLGGIPGNAQDQAFALPDKIDGLIEPSQYLEDIFGLVQRESAASNYFLNVHYALYTNQVPEALG